MSISAWVVAVAVLATTEIWSRIPRWIRHRTQVVLPTAELICAENLYSCPFTSFASTIPEFTTVVPSYGHGAVASPQSRDEGKIAVLLNLAPVAPSSGSAVMSEYGLPGPPAFAATHVSASVLAGSIVAVWNPAMANVTVSP